MPAAPWLKIPAAGGVKPLHRPPRLPSQAFSLPEEFPGRGCEAVLGGFGQMAVKKAEARRFRSRPLKADGLPRRRAFSRL